MTASSTTPMPEAERAKTLLVELLAIETQDEILKLGDAERVVEIGPGKVLATMTERTWKKELSQKDMLSSTQRTFLSISDDADKIYYEYEGEVAPQEPQQAPAAVQQPQAPSQPQSASVAAPAAAPVAAPAAVEDESLSPLDIITSIIAQKLKKPFDQIPTDKSIRDLCAGKSTLQNELVGDFSAEFGSLPDAPEDLPLPALAAALEGAFTGNPGKVMLSLIQRLVAAKMPAGLNIPAMKQRLEQAWGLPAGRQRSVICFAVTLEPPQRLASADAGAEFLDGVAKRYAAAAGITLAPGGGAGGEQQQQAAASIDPAALKALTEKQERFLRKQHELLAKQLDLEGGGGVPSRQLRELQAAQDELAGQLQRWSDEFGHDGDDSFLAGTQPTFDAAKARLYDSAWNWAREDLLALLLGKRPLPDEAALQHLLNRWDASCAAVAARFASQVDDVAPDEPSVALAETLLRRAPGTRTLRPVFRYLHGAPTGPRTAAAGRYEEVPRLLPDGRAVGSYVEFLQLLPKGERLRLRTKDASSGAWTDNDEATARLLGALEAGSGAGLCFAGKTALVTGAGAGSIAAEVVRGLLAGGARVIVTTSRTLAAVAAFYNGLYREHGAAGAELVVLPFNQGSVQDCEALVRHVYATYGDVDFVLPFAAVPEPGREVDAIDARSELALRIMLVNVVRLLGYIKREKEQRGFDTQPTQVVLPLSPNHGAFGGDGLYSASKAGLETLLHRVESENWAAYLSVCGAVIGWTRGTGLMSANNVVAEAVERQGCVTFSQQEMAFNILALMAPSVVELCEQEPVWADLGGGLGAVPGLKGVLAAARAKQAQESAIANALGVERELHDKALGRNPEKPLPAPPTPRATIRFNHPPLHPSHADLVAGLPNLADAVDLSHTVVVVGFSELGPWGSARTRWEVEEQGKLSWAGYVEMAWIMGLVRFFDGELKGKPYVGWVDAKTNEPVHDADFEARYGGHINAHAGIRTVEPAELDGYDPTRKELLQEVVVEEPLPPFETSKENAEAFLLKHGDKVDVHRVSPDADEWIVHVRPGARFLVPKAISSGAQTAGQLPSGWDARRYGIPDDIAARTDPVALYALCCVNEALLSAGIVDPYELWQHMHVSELANCVGSGCGNLAALRGVFRERYLDRAEKNDMLPDAFHNALDAWANMLLLSSAGPIRTPAGACATSVESLDIACEALRAGTAKMAIVGASDDFGEEFSFEFGSMRATADAVAEEARGRLPRETSRPTASSRAGFVYSAGCGIQVLTTADMALRMGLPIHAIVAHTQMAADKIGRSVPAPGKGVLTAAREDSSVVDSSPLLDLESRRRQLRADVAQVRRWRKAQLAGARSKSKTRAVEAAAAAKTRAAQRLWMDAAGLRAMEPGLSPLRAALAAWGLTIDDIAVASFHGTSTAANDKNESSVIDAQMAHLGRRPGNPLLVVCQKSVTGHPQGAAGAVMLNGCLQAVATGVVPGNRNADNVDAVLRQFAHLAYPSRSIRVADGIKAFMLTSFGFGQKGGIVLGVAPQYVFAACSAKTYASYRARALRRCAVANARLVDGLIENDLFRAKAAAPWTPEDELAVLLDPNARVHPSGPDGTLVFDPANLHPAVVAATGSDTDSDTASTASPVQLDSGYDSGHEVDAASRRMLGQLDMLPAGPHTHTTVGVDVENVANVNAENAGFLARNFTDAELEYCKAAPDPHASLAGRWAAKEAVFKSLNVPSRGAAAPMRDIEIVSGGGGVPAVKLDPNLHGMAGVDSDKIDPLLEERISNGVTIYGPPEVRKRLAEVVLRYPEMWKASPSFAKVPPEQEMNIPLKPGWEKETKLATKVYPLSARDRAVVDDTFDKLHDQGKLAWTKTHTVFGYPVFVVWKRIIKFYV
ncbi:fatty acid synthase subunit alpha [Diplodia corticola]|uniref:Fatty acid synthase subunit alpha n=1 Tax=Diplodia corticola TaxID=236234 RepID=A0A1J9RI02_9PEZI|nr:fatty acid synthase subunit alpha [Diplodia corticola]OJD32187.1 fatty acid synthase subunit alpha [Diplodia corticola]